MKKTSIVLATVAALAFSSAAIAAEAETTTKASIEADSKGNMDKKVKTTSTDSAGTKTVTEKKTSVDAKADGSMDKTVKTEETVDPKGLMNKTKTKTKEEVKTDASGNEMMHKKTVDGKVVEETTTEKK